MFSAPSTGVPLAELIGLNQTETWTADLVEQYLTTTFILIGVDEHAEEFLVLLQDLLGYRITNFVQSAPQLHVPIPKASLLDGLIYSVAKKIFFDLWKARPQSSHPAEAVPHGQT